MAGEDNFDLINLDGPLSVEAILKTLQQRFMDGHCYVSNVSSAYIQTVCLPFSVCRLSVCKMCGIGCVYGINWDEGVFVWLC